MKHFTNSDFWDAYDKLPGPIRRLADKNYRLLKTNPRHPSLRFEKVGLYWSVRVGRSHRALGTPVDDGVVWFWIGTHRSYDDLIK